VPEKRKVVFANGEIYHIYNRSVGNLEIFTGFREQQRALELLDYYRFPPKISFSKYKNLPKDVRQDYLQSYRKQKPFIEIFGYALMPGHFHILSRQLTEDGIKIFVSNFQNAFAKYFNTKSNRDGSVFKNSFKAKWVENDEIFLHISRYIHLNPVTSYIIQLKDLSTYPLTSYPYYLVRKSDSIVNTDFLSKIIGTSKKYQMFVENQVDYQRRLNLIKSKILE